MQEHRPLYPCPPGFNGRLAGAYRWFSGRPLNGHRYTDATFFRHGTMATDISGHASRYHLWPGWQRVAIVRLPAMASPAMAAAILLGHGTAVAILAILAILAVATAFVATRGRRRFRREVIEPLATAVATVTKQRHVAGRGHQRITVARDFRDDPLATVAIRLPMGWVADQGDMARIDRIVTRMLQVDSLVASWHAHGHQPHVQYALPVEPPKRVTFMDMLAMADRSEDPLVGLGARGTPEAFSLQLDSPHMLIAGGTGAGKSVLLAWLIAQFMRKGAGILVLDAKFVSHMWLRRIPGVHYASETEELHNALLWLDGELLRRARLAATGTKPEEFIRLVAVLEEMNAATNRLRIYWRDELGGKGMSPAITAMGNISSMGRELLVHVLMAGQSMTSKGVGGPENRENFGARALARATANQWRMLAPQIKPAPLKRHAPGRWHLVVGDTLKEFQVPFVDLKNPAELIAWATAGELIPDVSAMMLGLSSSIYESEEVPWSETKTTTLAEYVRGRQGLTLAQLQKWRERHAETFPAAVGSQGRASLYDPADLDLFVLTRSERGAD